MALCDETPRLARVIPIHVPRGGRWQGDLLAHLVSNPRHLAWLTERPVIRHFVDDLLLTQMVHARAEQVVIYHSAWRFEVDFWLEAQMHRVEIPNHRWALPIVLRLKRLAAMDVANSFAMQRGEIALPGDLRVEARLYPTRSSERLVLRPPRVGLRLAA